MFEFLKQDIDSGGSVFFRGAIPPRSGDLGRLAKCGIEVKPMEPGKDAHWRLRLRHRAWGEADVVCLRNVPPPPNIVIDHDINLTPAEREHAKEGRCSVSLYMKGKQFNALRDRKRMLRFLRAIMDDDGVVAADHVAWRLWSRDALDDELAHDADLDVTGIYTVHAVTKAEPDKRLFWVHTHGLNSVGAVDIDIVKPAPDLVHPRNMDCLRALAFASLEKRLSDTTAKFELGHPGGTVRSIPMRQFLRDADATIRADLEIDVNEDADHVERHAVICQPAGGFFGRFSRSARPSRFLSKSIPDGTIFQFSSDATALMAERARQTYPVFRELAKEFQEFEFPCLVKLGYQTDGGGPTDQEHLWFEVHSAATDSIDATLSNQPYNISRMKAGDRGRHGIDRMTDWVIITPFAPIDPRSLKMARLLREHGPKILERIRLSREEE